jgi:predicted O-methyltransferase YrrM
MSKKKSRPETPDGGGQIRLDANGFQRSRIILTAVELELFTAVGEGEKAAAEVAVAIDADPRATERLMNALCVLGYLKKTGDRYWNSPDAARFLVKGSPDYMGGLAHTNHLWDSWSTLTDAVRAGHTVHIREPAGRDEDWFEAFIAAMHYRARDHAEQLVAAMDLSGVHRVLDLGGGSGVYAMAFAGAVKEIEVVVFDQPQVVPLTERYVREVGLSDRITALSGDYRKDPMGGGYDLVFLSAIVHSNSPEENTDLVAKCVGALNPGGRVVIQDFIMAEDRTRPAHGALFALNMLVATARGDTYTEAEVKGWFGAAGITRIVRQETAFGTTQMIGWKPA